MKLGAAFQAFLKVLGAVWLIRIGVGRVHPDRAEIACMLMMAVWLCISEGVLASHRQDVAAPKELHCIKKGLRDMPPRRPFPG